MYRYIPNSINENYDPLKKLYYIFENKKISYKYENDKITITLNNKKHNHYIYHNELIPQYIFSDENKNSMMFEIYENINMIINEYDTIEDTVYDLINKIDKICINNNITKDISIMKDINKFRYELDKKKEKIINNLNFKLDNIKKKNIFSTRTNIEMLGDQLIILYSNNNFYVNITDFPDINIIMTNFTFKGSDDLNVIINMKFDINDIYTTPPTINITSNKILKDNILTVISNLKPFSDIKSWSIKYSISETIQHIFNMINTFGEVEKYYSSKLDNIINNLEYLVSIKNKNISHIKLLELFDKNLIENTKINSKTSNTYWKQGTGYGNNKTTKWNIDEYIENINNKKKKICETYNELILIIHDQYLEKNKFDETFNNESINKIVELLLHYIQNEDMIQNNIIMVCTIIDENFNKFSSNKSSKFTNLLNLIKSYMEDNNINHKLINKSFNIIKESCNNTTSSDPFILIFDKYRFIMNTNKFTNFYYNNIININSEKIARLKKEFNIIKKSIRVNSEASIFFWIDKNNLEKMRFILTGPSNTPYDQGLYIFDMTLSEEFPHKPPLVHFSNNGAVRFNPNLYACGKVCLSLLGTWRGDEGESWNCTISTLFQILISIQSQILIEEPYFNEPGHEIMIGTSNGTSISTKYNSNIRQYNLDYAINKLIEGVITNKSDYPEFNDIIRDYFKFKKDKILNILNKWELEFDDPSKKNKFIHSKNKFIELVNKL